MVTPVGARPRAKRSSHTPKTHGALIKVSTAKLRSGPGESHKAVALLDEGRSARVVERDGKWAKVRLDSGRTGWVRRDLIEIAKKATRDPDAPSAKSRKKHHDDDAPRVARRHSEPDRRSTERTFRSATAHKSGVVRRPAAKPLQVASRDDEKPAPESNDIPLSQHETLPVKATDEPEPEAPRDNITRARSALVGEALQLLEPERGAGRDGLISRARELRGTPYRFGSTGGGSFDCSGFTQYVFRRQGISLPRTAAEQFGRGSSVGRDELEAGDLVFFRNTAGRSGISHVGMFIGDGQFIHASSHGGVRVDPLSKDYYANHYAGARRVK